MEISPQLEPLVREALAAVVKSDPERLQRAILAFANDEALNEGAQLATAVSLVILVDGHGGQPTPEETSEVAAKLVEMEDWTDVTSKEVEDFLSAAYGGVKATSVLEADRVGPLSFLIAGSLLGSSCDDGEEWTDYLDRIEAIIETSR